jgi:hypothetical protein
MYTSYVRKAEASLSSSKDASIKVHGIGKCKEIENNLYNYSYSQYEVYCFIVLMSRMLGTKAEK